jgi:hypothetical protein
MEAILSFETSNLTRAMWCYILEDGILHSHCHENSNLTMLRKICINVVKQLKKKCLLCMDKHREHIMQFSNLEECRKGQHIPPNCNNLHNCTAATERHRCLVLKHYIMKSGGDNNAAPNLYGNEWLVSFTFGHFTPGKEPLLLIGRGLA